MQVNYAGIVVKKYSIDKQFLLVAERVATLLGKVFISVWNLTLNRQEG